jgi:toxin ParE1/3/4
LPAGAPQNNGGKKKLLSPFATGATDIDEIWEYTARRWNIEQAEIYIRQLRRDIEAVAARPTIGRPCPEVRKDYYKHPSGSHLLFYRPIDGGVDIVRILHRRMDFARHT